MIKIEGIKVLEQKNSKKITVKIIIKGKEYKFFYKIKNKYFSKDNIKNVDFLIPILFNIGYILGTNIDLNGFYLSNKLLKNIKDIEKLYNNWYGTNKHIKLINYNSSIVSEKTKNKCLFFSLGVDSFYTLYKTNIKNLIFVNGFDIRQKDTSLSKLVKLKFNKFCKRNNFNGLIIETDLRDFTENFCNRNYMFGACLASIGLLIGKYNKYYISSWMDDKIGYPRGSHKNLDYLRGNGIVEFIHFGTGVHRSEKINFISNYDDIYDYLRVCWKNYNNTYNCGICEKCIRTMFDFYRIGKLCKFSVLPTEFDVNLIDNIEITDANISYYANIVEMGNLDSSCLNAIKTKIKEYIPNKRRTKHKNIIFIDFNGVISYKNFWHSLEKKDRRTYEKINKFLFNENVQIVKDWMLGKYKTKEICKILADNLNIGYDYIYSSFIEDCKNIDLSIRIKNILKKLKKYYHIILVTDNMDCFSEIIVKNNLDYFSIFDSIFNSATKGYFKVDSYLDYIKYYDSRIELCYLIDDSHGNCRKFNELGGKCINVKGEEPVLQNLNTILREATKKRIRQI